MKSLELKLTFIIVLLLHLNSYAKVKIDRIGSTAKATTSIPSKPGFKGCNGVPKPVKGYIFQLHKKSKKETACHIGPPPDWKIEESIPTNNNSHEFSNLPEGDYKVVVLYARPIGCILEEYNTRSIFYTQEESREFTIEEKENNKHATDSDSNNGILLYPNPADKFMKIEVQAHTIEKIKTIQILDMNGTVVFNEDNFNEHFVQEVGEFEISTGNFSSGNYIILIVDEHNNYHRIQFVIIHENETPSIHHPLKNIKN